MWIVEHVAVGYVLWSAWTRLRAGRPPTDAEFWAVVLAGFLPDIVDKPLAWTFGVLPAGRSLAHSLVTATIVLAVIRRIAVSRGRGTLATAFGLGWVSHILGDTVVPILSGEYGDLTFLLWPILPLPYHDAYKSLTTEVLVRIPIALAGPHLLVALATLLLWIVDGMPGLPRRWVTGRLLRQER